MQTLSVRPHDRCSRLLYICGSPLVPAKIGPARRNQQIVRYLARHFSVTVLGVGSNDHASVIQDYCRGLAANVHLVANRASPRAKFLHKAVLTAAGHCDYLPARLTQLREACAELVSRNSYDAIVLASPLLHTLPLPRSVPVVVDTHNVEFDVHRRTAASATTWARRLYATRQAGATWKAERDGGNRAALVLATSERDRELFARSFSFRDTAVVRNGIDLDEFAPAPPSRGAPTILFTGLMSYFPNQDGIRWFLDRVWPQIHRRTRDARVVIAGAAPPRWLQDRASAHVTVTGAVRDMRPILADANVVVAPLTIGGGTRVKILEAQAMSRPVVSTHIGAEGLAQRHRQTILLADNPDAFAAQVSFLLGDSSGAEQLATAGRQHVQAHFDWEVIGQGLAQLLCERIGLESRMALPMPWGVRS